MPIMAPRTPKNAPSTTTALVNIDQKLAEAAGGTAVEKPSGGTKISTKGGKLTYGGTQFPNNEVDVIVLEFAAKNVYYAGAYDPDNISPPDCFAIELAVGKDFEDNLKPHTNVEEPVNPTCLGCKWNEFKSADNGKGKACKNRRDLAVIPATVLDEAEADVAKAIADAEIAVFSVSPSNISVWKGFVAGVARASLPLWGVTTRIGIGLPSVFDQSFQVVEDGDLKPKLTQAVWDALGKKRAEARELLVVPYEPLSEEQKAQASAPKGRQASAPKGRQAAPSGRSARFTAPVAAGKKK
jgi:hypothetical protein